MIKRKLLILALIFQFHTVVYSQQPEKLTQIEDFGNNPGNLKLFVYNEQKQDSILKPLVIVLHGCGQSAENVSDLTGWNKLAKLNNFTVIYPQQKFINNPSLCFNWFNTNDIEKGKGECESIYQMIRYISSNYKIDNNRIFVTGLSAGAAMSVVMLATHPETFKAGAIFAGCAYKLATNPLMALKVMRGKNSIPENELTKKVEEQNANYIRKYPLMIIYQGLDDNIVSHENSNFLIQQWTGINKCDSIPDKTETLYNNIPDITRKEYLSINAEKLVIYYEVQNLRHEIMVKPGKNYDEGGKTGMFGVNKNFHSTFQTAIDFDIIKK